MIAEIQKLIEKYKTEKELLGFTTNTPNSIFYDKIIQDLESLLRKAEEGKEKK